MRNFAVTFESIYQWYQFINPIDQIISVSYYVSILFLVWRAPPVSIVKKRFCETTLKLSKISLWENNYDVQ